MTTKSEVAKTNQAEWLKFLQLQGWSSTLCWKLTAKTIYVAWVEAWMFVEQLNGSSYDLIVTAHSQSFVKMRLEAGCPAMSTVASQAWTEIWEHPLYCGKIGRTGLRWWLRRKPTNNHNLYPSLESQNSRTFTSQCLHTKDVYPGPEGEVPTNYGNLDATGSEVLAVWEWILRMTGFCTSRKQ